MVVQLGPPAGAPAPYRCRRSRFWIVPDWPPNLGEPSRGLPQSDCDLGTAGETREQEYPRSLNHSTFPSLLAIGHWR